MRNKLAELYWVDKVLAPCTVQLLRAQDNLKDILKEMYHYSEQEANTAVFEALSAFQAASELYDKLQAGEISAEDLFK